MPEKDLLLYDLLQALIQGRDLDSVSRILYRQLQAILPVDRLGIAFMDPEHKFFYSKVNISKNQVLLREGFKTEVRRSSLKQIIDSANPRIINSLKQYLSENPASISTRLVVNEGMRSNLSLPLIANNKPIGILFLASTRENAYTEDHVTLVRQFSHVISITLEKALLLENLHLNQQKLVETLAEKEGLADQLEQRVQYQSRQINEELERNRLLLKVAVSLNDGFTLEEVFRKACKTLTSVFPIDLGFICLQLPGENKGTFKAAFPSYPPEILPNKTFKLNESLLQSSMEKKSPVFNLKLGGRSEEEGLLKNSGMEYCTTIPLTTKGKVTGLFLLAHKQKPSLSNFHRKLLEGLSLQLAVALGHTDVFESMMETEKRLNQQNRFLREEILGHDIRDRIIGHSEIMQQLRNTIKKVATTDSTVLILGETGTGKELIAKAIHEESNRNNQLLVSVNCAALSSSIIESELFGHVRGSFTGAVQDKIGRFELASSGTLFLDEIAELPLELQAKILRTLQEGYFEKVGSLEPQKTDARIIAATNRDLQKAIKAGKFRSDLFYRLNVFPIFVPPLRERKEDIVPLLYHFLERLRRKFNRPALDFNPQSISWAQAYAWPGNIREMQNLVERSVILSREDQVTLIDAGTSNTSRQANPDAPEAFFQDGELSKRTWNQWEELLLQSVLKKTRGRIYGKQGAAALLDLPPTTLQGKLRKFGINRK